MHWQKQWRSIARVIAHRISGNWDPATTSFDRIAEWRRLPQLIIQSPILFTWLMQLKKTLLALGDPDEWQAEWKWDGIRGQIIKRNNELFVWSRGEELMTEKFPEYACFKKSVAWWYCAGWRNYSQLLMRKPLPFALVANTNRQKKYYKKTIAGSADYLFCLRSAGIRMAKIGVNKTLIERREILEEIINAIQSSRYLSFTRYLNLIAWEELAEHANSIARNGQRRYYAEKKRSPFTRWAANEAIGGNGKLIRWWLMP